MHKNICNSSHECSLKRKCWLLEWRIIFCMKMMIILLLWHWSMMTTVTMLKQCSEFTTWWVLNYDESAAVYPELSSNGHYCRVLQSTAEYCRVCIVTQLLRQWWGVWVLFLIIDSSHLNTDCSMTIIVSVRPMCGLQYCSLLTHSSMFHHHQWQMSL